MNTSEYIEKYHPFVTQNTVQLSQFLVAVIIGRGQRNLNLLTSTYPAFVDERWKSHETHQENCVHASLGLGGEAGETVDVVKKYWVYNKPLDAVHVLEEAGDILYYLQKLLSLTGWTIEDALNYNIAKLTARYPTGYSDQAAQARADKKITGETE